MRCSPVKSRHLELFCCCLAAVFIAASARADEIELSHVWQIATPTALPQAVVEDQHGRPYFYAALKQGGMSVYKLFDPGDTPVVVASLPVVQFGGLDVMHLTQRRDFLFLALGDFFKPKSAAGLSIVSVQNPAAPKVVGLWKSPGQLKGSAVVAVEGRHAYLGTMNNGVIVLDVQDPSAIKNVTTFQPDVNFPRPNPGPIQHPNARGMTLVGNRLFVAYDAGGLRVLDVSDPANPRELSRYINVGMDDKQQAYNNIVIENNVAYVAIDYAGLEILDVSDVNNIRQLGWWNPWGAETNRNWWFNSPGHTNQIALDRKNLRAYLSAGDSELLVLDVADPSAPVLVASVGGPKNKRGTWGVALGNRNTYLTYIQTFVPFRGTFSGIVGVSPVLRERPIRRGPPPR
ncbi:MAG: LVIVD repeat-containing protein [Aeoliella sp.]